MDNKKQSSSSILIEMGERVKELREAKNLSQQDLADRMGFNSRSSITLIEKGRRSLTTEKIAKLARILNTTPDYLLGLCPPISTVQSAVEGVQKTDNANIKFSQEMGARIKALREAKNLSQQELADRIGFTSSSSITLIEKGRRNLTPLKVSELARVLDTTPLYLLGIQPEPNTVQIPVVGEVITGEPVDAVEECLGYEEIPTSLARTGEFYALKVKGDSMEPRIAKGDHLIVKRQSTANNGDIVIVSIAEDLATCKQLLFTKGGITLISFNSFYKPMVYSNEEIRNLPVTILGRVIENRQKY